MCAIVSRRKRGEAIAVCFDEYLQAVQAWQSLADLVQLSAVGVDKVSSPHKSFAGLSPPFADQPQGQKRLYASLTVVVVSGIEFAEDDIHQWMRQICPV